jgi:hypothetical protein
MTRNRHTFGCSYRIHTTLIHVDYPVLSGMRKTTWISVAGNPVRSVHPKAAAAIIRAGRN